MLKGTFDLWHDIYYLPLGHVSATCRYCQKKFFFEGLERIPNICPQCHNKAEEKNINN